MISVYSPIGGDGFQLCQPVHLGEFKSIDSLISGELPSIKKKLPAMEILEKDGPISLSYSHAPWLGSQALIFREAVIDSIRDVLKGASLHEVRCGSDCLYLCDPPIAIKALNEAESVVDRFSDGRVMAIKKYVFSPAAVTGFDIFKIENFRVSPTFVSQRFVDLWRSHAFLGLDFLRVWSGDNDPLSEPKGSASN